MVFVNSVIRISTETKVDRFSIWKSCAPFVWWGCAADANNLLHIRCQESFPQKFANAPGTKFFLGICTGIVTDTNSTCVLASFLCFFVNNRVKSDPNAKPTIKSYMVQ